MMGKNYIELRLNGGIEIQDHFDTCLGGTFLGVWEQEGLSCFYWRNEGQADRILAEIKRALAEMGVAPETAIRSLGLIPDQDWNVRWTDSIRPIRIGKRIVIRQSWNTAALQPGDIELVIDPKRAFGSGYHQTTRMLLEWLEEVIRGGERLLDWGTGSGILAMGALRLGARSALAIDSDPVAVEIAGGNALLNGFGGELELRVGSLEDVRSECFDLILANLDRPTLLKFCPRLGGFLRPGGSALLSGLQVQDYEDISAALLSAGAILEACRELDDWLALRMQSPPAEL